MTTLAIFLAPNFIIPKGNKVRVPPVKSVPGGDTPQTNGGAGFKPSPPTKVAAPVRAARGTSVPPPGDVEPDLSHLYNLKTSVPTRTSYRSRKSRGLRLKPATASQSKVGGIRSRGGRRVLKPDSDDVVVDNATNNDVSVQISRAAESPRLPVFISPDGYTLVGKSLLAEAPAGSRVDSRGIVRAPLPGALAPAVYTAKSFTSRVSKVRKHVVKPLELSKTLPPPRTDVFVSLRPGSRYKYHLSMDDHVYTISLVNKGSRAVPVILPINKIKNTAEGPVGWVPPNAATKEPSGMRVRGILRTAPKKSYSDVASPKRQAYLLPPLDLTDGGRGVEPNPGPNWHIVNPDLPKVAPTSKYFGIPEVLYSCLPTIDFSRPRLGQVSSVLEKGSVDGLRPDVGPHIPQSYLSYAYDKFSDATVSVSTYLFGKPLTKLQQQVADIKAITWAKIERKARLVAGDTSELEALFETRCRIAAGIATLLVISGCVYLWSNGTFTRVYELCAHARDSRGLEHGAEELASGLGNGVHDRRTLNHALFSLMMPIHSSPVSRDPTLLWLRAFLGGSGYYATLNVPLMNFTHGGVRFVRRGEDITAMGVSGPFQFQSVGGLISRPLATRPTVSFGVFARHLTVHRMSTLTGFGAAVEISTYSPGPLHICTPACSNYNRGLFRDLPPIRTYGSICMVDVGDDTYLSWGDTSHPRSLPTTVLLETVARWQLAGKVTQYATISIGLRDYPDCIPLVMAAVGAGFRIPGGYRADLGNTEVLLTTDSTIELDPAQSNILVHNPILPNSLVNLGRGIEALTESVDARVRSNTNLNPVSMLDLQLVADFANYVVGGVRLQPLDIESVYAAMHKPSNIAEQNEMSTTYDLVDNEAGLFSKTEPVKGDGKSARIIVTFRGNENYELGRYVIPLTDHLSRLPFWAPGKTPREIQEFIHLQHLLARSHKRNMEEGDYSAFDSTTGPIGYAVENSVFQLAFGIGGDWQGPLDFVHNVTAKARTRPEGLRVEMGNGTMSGCKNTTMRNTLLCAFVAYANARDSGMLHDSAVERVESCVFSGDDSSLITCDFPMATTAKRFGLLLESRQYDSGPTTFLGRFYPDPYASPSCIADVPRFLRKMHLIDVPPNRDPHTALAQRALGNLVNDPKTPLLSSYCRSVLKANFTNVLDPRYHDPWKYESLTSGNMYTNDDFSYDELFEAIAKHMGVDPAALAELDTAFKELPGVVGTKYPALGHHVISYRAGRVINGVPFGPPGVRPDIRMARKVSAAMSRLHKETLENLTTVLESAASSVPSVGSGEAYVPLCVVCDSQYHSSDNCPLCSLCSGRGHTAASCTRDAEARLDSDGDEILLDMGFTEAPKQARQRNNNNNKGRNGGGKGKNKNKRN